MYENATQKCARSNKELLTISARKNSADAKFPDFYCKLCCKNERNPCLEAKLARVACWMLKKLPRESKKVGADQVGFIPMCWGLLST